MIFLRCFIMCVYMMYDPALVSKYPLQPSMSKLTRNVDGEHDVADVRESLAKLAQRPGSEVDHSTLAQDADGVEDEEGVVAQEDEGPGLEAAQGDGEVGVADDLGDAPGEEHGGVGGALGEPGEGVDDAPDEGVAAEDLDEGGREGSADDAWGGRS